jgi:hypothetical protein
LEEFVVVVAAEKHRECDGSVRALWFHQRMSRTTESASALPVVDAVAVLAVHTKFAEVGKEEWTDTFPTVAVVKAETLHSTEIQVVEVHLLTVTFH